MTVRVLIVDDSATSRLLLRRVLSADPGIELVGEATSGEEALRLVPTLQPHIVLMDVVMVGMSGLTATRRLLEKQPVRVLLVSELASADEALNLRAQQLGALDLLRKPTAAEAQDSRLAARFARRVRRLAEVPLVTRTRRAARKEGRSASSPALSLVAVGSSTGGPAALREFFGAMGGPPPIPVLLVQHISEGFAAGFHRWLSDDLGLPVQIVDDLVSPRPGVVVAAPGLDLVCRGSGVEARAPNATGAGGVDRLFESVATHRIGAEVAGVLLSGMGRDGAAGLLALRRAGARTLAQDEDSSVVWGMPGAAVALEAASMTGSPAQLGARLERLFSRLS